MQVVILDILSLLLHGHLSLFTTILLFSYSKYINNTDNIYYFIQFVCGIGLLEEFIDYFMPR